jgi:hypothetical protein
VKVSLRVLTECITFGESLTNQSINQSINQRKARYIEQSVDKQ